MIIRPKLLVDRTTRRLFAYTGHNKIAWRFGQQIGVVEVKKVWGPCYRKIGTPFFDGANNFERPKPAEPWSLRRSGVYFAVAALWGFQLALRLMDITFGRAWPIRQWEYIVALAVVVWLAVDLGMTLRDHERARGRP